MIRCLNITFANEADLDALPAWLKKHPGERLLIQVFSGIIEDRAISALITALGRRFPGAALIGTTTAGEILGAQSQDNTIVISFSAFEHATVRAALASQNDDQTAAATDLSTAIEQPDTRAIITFGCGIKEGRTIFAERFLNELKRAFPDAIISGGQAGDNGKGSRTLVFTADGSTDSGFAAVSIASQRLTANNAYTLSWVPIGKKLTITHAEGSRVYAIDGKPPYDIYSHYLGKEVADGLPLSAADFPLMIERDGVLMAIHATGVNPDGSFNYIHHFHAGEQLRFGYCHAGLLAIGAAEMRDTLSASQAEAMFIYSCVSRKWILGTDILVELAPVAELAPTTGFFCYGEYYGRPGTPPLFLSQTLTALSLSESAQGETRQSSAPGNPDAKSSTSRQFRTMSVLHRLVETAAREIESINTELASLARKDSLTGLFNRRAFDEHLERELRRASRSLSPISLIFLDVDYFKNYNDAHGHIAGDGCLRCIGRALQNVAQRASDLIVRYGGEEFAIILPDTQFKAALQLAEDIRAHVERLELPHTSSPTTPHVTVSLGVVTAHAAANMATDALVDAADRQLYQAKRAGRNCVTGIEMGEAVTETPDN